MFPVSRNELERLARAHGRLFVELAAISPEILGRSDISGTQVLTGAR
jgi:hypothetical protein